MKPNKKKLAIVGSADTTRDFYPEIFENPDEFEVWSMLTNYNWIPRVDRFIEIHDPAIWQPHLEHALRLHPEAKWYVRTGAELVPGAVVIDPERYASKYRRYFVSSFAWFAAMAIDEGFLHWYLPGFNMAAESEYAFQRPNAEYWIGIVEGLGGTVEVPPTSALCKSNALYGFEEITPLCETAIQREREAEKLVREYRQKMITATERRAQIRGQLTVANAVRLQMQHMAEMPADYDLAKEIQQMEATFEQQLKQAEFDFEVYKEKLAFHRGEKWAARYWRYNFNEGAPVPTGGDDGTMDE